MLIFEFPRNLKQNLAEKWLRINRVQPATITGDMTNFSTSMINN